MRHGAALSAALLAALLAAGPARADPAPRIFRLLFPEGEGDAVLVTNRGLVFADGASGRFRLVCHRALDVGVGDLPSVAILGGGRVVAGTPSGLRATADGGCTWSGLGQLGSVQTPAVARHPEERDTLHVSTFGPGQSALNVTRDGGETFTVTEALADGDFVHSLVIAADAPDRIYAAGIASGGGGPFTHFVLRSTDGGSSFSRFVTELGSLDERAAVLAVRPGSSDELVLKTTALDPARFPERVLVSRDGGETFETVFQGEKLTAAAYTDGGKELWVANEEGLWRSIDDLRTFERQGPATWMSAVAEHDGLLWASGHLAGEGGGPDGVGTSVDDGQTFTVFMDLLDVTEPVACGEEAATAITCSEAWAHWQVEVLGQDPGQTGSGGTSVGAGGAPGGAGGETWQAAGAKAWGGGPGGTAGRGGGDVNRGCATSARPASGSDAWLLALALGALATGRVKPRVSPPPGGRARMQVLSPRRNLRYSRCRPDR